MGLVEVTNIHADDGTVNTIRITRLDSTITLWLNGAEIKQFSDTLFGDHAPIKVGIGAVTQPDDGTTVHFEVINILSK